LREKERKGEREREVRMFWGFVDMITSLGNRSQIMEGLVLRGFVEMIDYQPSGTGLKSWKGLYSGVL
jgi:hypothetical protein